MSEYTHKYLLNQTADVSHYLDQVTGTILLCNSHAELKRVRAARKTLPRSDVLRFWIYHVNPIYVKVCSGDFRCINAILIENTV
jgi:hypothetical protein